MAIMPKNFTIESGTASLEQLIHDCDDGVYVFENYDQFHALNVVSGDFSFPCKAVRIKEGKPVGIMEGLTMTGNVAELFARVEQVGSDRVINPLVMYDSYTVSGPAMLVKITEKLAADKKAKKKSERQVLIYMKIIEQEEVRKLLQPKDCIQLMAEALKRS